MFAAPLVAIVTIGLLGTAGPSPARAPDPAELATERRLAVSVTSTATAPAVEPGLASSPANTAEPQTAQRRASSASAGQAQPRQRRPEPSSGRSAGTSGGQGQGRAVPRESRPREDNPPTGTAVPRGQAPGGPGTRPPDSGRHDGPYYRPYYQPYYGPSYRPYSPWYYSPYFYGAFGFSYFYWDPAWYGGWGYGPGFGAPYPYYDEVGSLRLKMKPREAQVFVNGYLVGIVDEFDGTFQRLRLPGGPYRIEVRAPGFETAVLDLYLQPGHTITIERVLQPAP